MEVIIVNSSKEGSQIAADLIKKQILTKPDSVLGLATGKTPLLLYKNLIKMNQTKEIDFKSVITFNLDEYLGLSSESPDSYSFYMNQNLFSHININMDNTHLLDGTTSNIENECQSYEEKIQKCGGIDLQILGLGREGHIGFNELSSSLSSRTRLKTLTWQTMRDNEKYFKDKSNQPYHVLTIGIGTIMDSRHIVLMAFGEAKAEAVAKSIEGSVTAMVPASILQMHKKVAFIVDEAAASNLQNREYYKWVYKNKPNSQV